jgi:pimeloyl-ACP methyl ester carboxylesterase
MKMEAIRSADGTMIAFERAGSGPALIPVLGAFCDRATAAPFVDSFAGAYSVYRYDRRGRGDSGDTQPYSPEREVEDLDAVISAIGEPAFVFGHSSGGALGLEAAARGLAISKLAVYEPPYVGGGASAEFAQSLEDLVASGQRSEAAERFILNTGAPAERVREMKSADSWRGMEAIAHTLPYDVRLCNGGAVPTKRLADVSCTVLAMAGGESAPWAREAIETIVASVQSGESQVLEGHSHGPPVAVLAPTLTGFFT